MCLVFPDVFHNTQVTQVQCMDIGGAAQGDFGGGFFGGQ